MSEESDSADEVSVFPVSGGRSPLETVNPIPAGSLVPPSSILVKEALDFFCDMRASSL
ncbi:hypothetical protein DY000_02038548 [Brassica cretica]|uniref:Uncharacterized protein n=1 Tax=Brassica cretica TaxID=69181 RepID=A0ABQ7BKL7_BRACR|nr:hypothetical protein DY000_02038548 [Brassica cretica]